MHDRTRPRERKGLNITLWVLQGLLALFFGLASGAPKLLMPYESLPMPIPIPPWFVKLIGTGEVLGALGLILPGVTRIRPGLTVLAAGGLAFVAFSATVAQLMGGAPGNAIFALGMALLCSFVAYGRLRLVPLGRARSARLT